MAELRHEEGEGKGSQLSCGKWKGGRREAAGRES